jgi:hypothetical protein
VDAQSDAAQRKLMRIEFDTCNMPVGHFVSAGKGWQEYRQGKADGERFGLGGKDGWEGIGWDIIMPNDICDTMALNKVELLPWEVPAYWTKKQTELSADDTELRDRLAAASWNQIRLLYDTNDTLHMPANFETQQAEE